MQFTQVGRNSISHCEHCDELFVVKGTDAFVDSIEQLEKMAETHRSQSPACQKWYSELPSFSQLMESLRSGAKESTESRSDANENNPHNGTVGYWRVTGIRHEATAKAESAPDAIAKCIKAGFVGDWECATAEFIGVELPEVF